MACDSYIFLPYLFPFPYITLHSLALPPFPPTLAPPSPLALHYTNPFRCPARGLIYNLSIIYRLYSYLPRLVLLLRKPLSFCKHLSGGKNEGDANVSSSVLLSFHFLSLSLSLSPGVREGTGWQGRRNNLIQE